MEFRLFVAAVALLPIACAGLIQEPSAVSSVAREVTIGELIGARRAWQLAVQAGRYDRARAAYERWGDGLRAAGPETRGDPDFAENEAAYGRGASLDRRVEKVVALQPRSAEIEDLMASFRQEAGLNTEVARTLVDSDDRIGQLEQLRLGVERLKALRRQGRPFEAVEPYRSFSAWEGETIAWLETRADEAEWAIKAGLLISTPISAGARATQLAREARDQRERRQHLKTATTSFRECLTVAGDVARAGGYAPDFPLDTPAGRVSLATLQASCKKASAKVARMARTRPM